MPMLKHLTAAALVLGSLGTASARNLDAIAEFVRPAYTAMNFAAICVRDNPSFPTETAGPSGTIFHYAQQAKDEAIEGLSHAEALTVLKTAADAARAVARKHLYALVVNGDDRATVAAVRAWCDSDAKAYVRSVMRSYEEADAEGNADDPARDKEPPVQ